MSLSSKLGEQKSVRLPQGTIRYRERGHGAPIVFVHGVLASGDLAGPTASLERFLELWEAGRSTR